MKQTTKSARVAATSSECKGRNTPMDPQSAATTLAQRLENGSDWEIPTLRIEDVSPFAHALWKTSPPIFLRVYKECPTILEKYRPVGRGRPNPKWRVISLLIPMMESIIVSREPTGYPEPVRSRLVDIQDSFSRVIGPTGESEAELDGMPPGDAVGGLHGTNHLIQRRSTVEPVDVGPVIFTYRKPSGVDAVFAQLQTLYEWGIRNLDYIPFGSAAEWLCDLLEEDIQAARAKLSSACKKGVLRSLRHRSKTKYVHVHDFEDWLKVLRDERNSRRDAELDLVRGKPGTRKEDLKGAKKKKRR